MSYSLISALNSLTQEPRKFSYYKSKTTNYRELVIGSVGTSDMKTIAQKAGSAFPVAKGNCCWTQDNNTVVFHLTQSSPDCKTGITLLCRSQRVQFVDPPPRVEGVQPEGNGVVGEGDNPLPQIEINPPPQIQPQDNLDQPPPVRTRGGNAPPMQRPNQPPNQNPPPPQQQIRERVAPPGRKLVPVLPSKISERWSPSYLTNVKKVTDRGGFKGRGKFGDVFDGVEKVSQYEQKLRGNNGQLDEEGRNKLIQVYDKMIKNVGVYMAGHEEVSTDQVVQVKQLFCRTTETTLRLGRAQLKCAQKYERLNQLREKQELTDDEFDDSQQTRAELFLRMNEEKEDQRPSTGTSDVRFIRDDRGQVAYVFKSVDGESDQMGFDKGVGTAHEVLTSKLSDILGTFGFNTGFPKTSLATLPLSGVNGERSDKVGALVEGITGRAPMESGERLPEAELLEMAGIELDLGTRYARFRKEGVPDYSLQGKVRQELGQMFKVLTTEQKEKMYQTANVRLEKIGRDPWPKDVQSSQQRDDMTALFNHDVESLALQVPPVQMQQTLLTGLLSGGADIKWSNVMIDGENARPFDGGGNMLTPEQLKKTATRRDQSVMCSYGEAMLYLPTRRGLHPGATQPIDPNLKNQVLGIDPNVVEQEMRTAVDKVKRVKGMENSAGEGNVQMAVTSLVLMQSAIREADPNATMQDIVNAYNLKLQDWMVGDDFPNAPAH